MGRNYKPTVDNRRNASRSSASRNGEVQLTALRLSPRLNGSPSFPDHAWDEVGRMLRLSGRELQIVRGMFNDKIQYAIAAELGISPHTVHTHIERLYHKLGAANRAQMLVRVMTAFVALAAHAKIPAPAGFAAAMADG
jgi:DNA-binding CsgD family transcriptional regulator